MVIVHITLMLILLVYDNYYRTVYFIIFCVYTCLVYVICYCCLCTLCLEDAAMPVMKIDLKKLAEELHNEVLYIEGLDVPQAEKTRRHQRAASKVMNQMYLDRRRYRGKAKENRISLNTFISYLTRLRTMLSEMGLRHHLLDREVERLAKRYPEHAGLVATLADKPPKETRLAKKAAIEALSDELEAQDGLNRINWANQAAGRKLTELMKRHPALQLRLGKLREDEARPAALAELHRYLDEAEGLRRDLTGLKVDHEVIVALRLPDDLKEQRAKATNKALEQKQRSVFHLDYPAYVTKVLWALEQPHNRGPKSVNWDYHLLVFGLCAATGRRPVEILLTGQFEKVDRERLRFTGQAKKRDDAGHSYVIYTLADADLVLAGFKALREHSYTEQLHGLETDSRYDVRDTGKLINDRLAGPLNVLAKKVFAPDIRRVFYDCRAVYAAICARRYLESDPRWRSGDGSYNRSAFTSELLGHDDPTAQLAYESVKIDNYQDGLPGLSLEEAPPRDRLAALQALDDRMPGLARGDAAVAIHDKVKAMVAADPAVKITQSLVSRETGANRNTIKRYLETVAEALGITRDDSGRVRTGFDQVIEAPVVRWVSEPVPEEADEPEPADAGEPVEQDAAAAEDGQAEPDEPGVRMQPNPPRWHDKPSLVMSRQGDRWRVAMQIGFALHHFQVTAGSPREAGLAAWQQWLALWDTVRISARATSLGDKKGWEVSAATPDGRVLERIQCGSEKEARAGLARELAKEANGWKALGK